tara:strand:+ start:1240 stop:1620 length:381 start_codon:yes stop_codon:yes gene_type:complete
MRYGVWKHHEEPRPRCARCGYVVYKTRCRICRGKLVIRGVRGDKDFLFSPVGRALHRGYARTTNQTFGQAWHDLTVLLAYSKMMKRARQPKRSGWRVMDVLETEINGLIVTRYEARDVEEDRCFFW